MPDRQGGCLCGAVRYVLKGEPRVITICHCTHCRKLSGSPFSFNLAIRETDFERNGETKLFMDTGSSGNPVHRHFCGNCGSPIFAKIAAAPGKVIVKAGTLDNPDGLQPRVEIHTEHSLKWLAPVTGTTRFAQEP
ncbi:GFA family protein [Burkholderia plantarii]|uniref:GFA family protein n=1 Tax=Burkholderia plantarii TaxID=41899 RepID=UPI0018DB97CC|nr:GFA family protein [Burkholderia plantarii]MBI0326865.1 GFA family protein [Burkholderia plantarii]